MPDKRHRIPVEARFSAEGWSYTAFLSGGLYWVLTLVVIISKLCKQLMEIIMSKERKVKSEVMITEYNQKILDILQETGASDVFPLIEGLQERIKNLEKTIINKRSKNEKIIY